MFGLSPAEVLVIGAVAVLLFGKNLPSVAKSVGKSFNEFKRGMSGIQEEFLNGGEARPKQSMPRYHEIDDREEATAPKFEPPTTAPQHAAPQHAAAPAAEAEAEKSAQA